MVFDVVIIGAGASGLMVASLLKKKSIAIIDGNSKIGAKILVSGGGKCNVTNDRVSSNQYYGDSSFFDSVYSRFDNRKLLTMLKQGGVVPTIQKGVVKNQYFCKTSQDMISYFKKRTKHVRYFLNEKVISVTKDDLFTVETSNQKLRAKRVVVASGGVSYSQLGASNIGHTIASSFGHVIERCDPALVGLTVLPEQKWFTTLSGLSADVAVTVDDKVVHGSLLCAHKGVSGPAIMVASLYWKKGKIAVDFLPKVELNTLLKKAGKRNVSTVLPLPKRFSKAILTAIGVTDSPCNQLSQSQKEQLQQLKRYEFAPAGTFGFKRAEVTRGGVSTDELDSSTMESRLVDGLYFTGEVVNMTGELGGYNFQWAFSSGFVCAEALQE